MENIELRSAHGILSLLGIKGLGPATATKLADRFRTLGDAMNAGMEGLKGFANEPIRKVLCEGRQQVREAVDKAAGEVARAADIEATLLTVYDDAYPQRLKGIEDRPLVLWTSGDLSLLERSVACVGTREPTRFGAAAAERITTMLGEGGWTIVSGLARGIDSICHHAALRCGAPTAAILGSGIDTYSSDAAFSLASRIVDAGGIIISEQPLGREADPSSLIRRNRIQTGVSLAAFMLQANMESGTMHTVKYALRQGRPIYVPGVPKTFANEELNQAAMCMARMDAGHFGALIDAKGSLADAIERLDRSTVAIEIAGRESYPAVLADLDGRLQNEFTHGAAPSM